MPLYPNMPSRRRVPSAPEALGSGDVSVTADGRGGLAVRDGRPDAEWGRIASHVTANEYTALRLDDGDTAYPDRDALTVRCWEVSGSSGVAPGTKVRLEPNRAGEGYTFRAPATGGGSALTVQEADGAPSLTGITTLRFDQADGFTLTNPSAGVARIDSSAAFGSGLSQFVAVWDGLVGTSRTLTHREWSVDATTFKLAGVADFECNNVECLSATASNSSLVAATIVADGTASPRYARLSLTESATTATVSVQSDAANNLIVAVPSGYLRLDGIAFRYGSAVADIGKSGTINPGARAAGGIVVDLGTAVSPPPPPPPAGQPPPYLDPGGDWNYPLGSEQGSKAAAGSNQSGATEITDLTTEVTGADGTKGVRLPDAPGPRMIWQSSSSALAIYPPTGGKINGGVTDAAVTITAIGGWRAMFWRLSATEWWYMLFG